MVLQLSSKFAHCRRETERQTGQAGVGQGVNPLPKSLSLRMSYSIWCHHSEWLKDTMHQASPLAADKVPPADSSAAGSQVAVWKGQIVSMKESSPSSLHRICPQSHQQHAVTMDELSPTCHRLQVPLHPTLTLTPASPLLHFRAAPGSSACELKVGSNPCNSD